MLLENQWMLSCKQAKVIREAKARWNILSGAVRSGKTYGSFFLLPFRIAEQGEGNFLLIGKTERTLKRNIIDPLRELYTPQCVSQVYGDGLVDIFGRRCYVVGANDERAVTKIQGIGLVYAYGDEVTTCQSHSLKCSNHDLINQAQSSTERVTQGHRNTGLKNS